MATSGVPPSALQFHQPRCIFLIHTINIEVDDDFDVVVPIMPSQLYQIADAHLLPLKAILDTPLNYLGGVQSIYINFGHRGLYELHKPRDHLFCDMTPRQFKNILREMFLTGRVLNPQRIEELAHKVLDMDTFLAALPLNCRKIGVLSGPDPADIAVVDLWEFVNSAYDDETLLFVVGNFVGSEIEGNLEEVVKVSQYELNDATLLGTYCAEFGTQMEHLLDAIDGRPISKLDKSLCDHALIEFKYLRIH